ncbi:chorismate mutase / prephenate dehydratase [Campylobacter subantarcticus]|uniref:Bifunctional chorismate mutase/prephenate dehydratase n=1 Tax=Campylobacter subantarcticus LMG 24374 TaxID=1388751 RepID=A0A0A8HEK6_9BACT|nr:chorismate mutase / prephenate dehydratase [Campylobacter subantarcticus]AJC91359.1 chorismate mutase / prephenate dehydratase [Campylobacter subantarcticus LMG 24374]EAJ1261047.1 chorismate mutase / prephenate dehydratase [Campylobacter lari]EAJ1262041.1 chorismate mutase / prephenate dehydratase [Campylobacter lari]
MKDIEKLRNKIDTIDDKILALLNERMLHVKDIGVIKQNLGGSIYRPERERAIINRLKNYNHGLLDQNAIEAIYQEIFAVSRNLEMPQSIAYLGPEGSYTHQVARTRFGAMSRYTPLANIEDVFKELAHKEAKYGVVPIENNTAGAVGVTLDCLGKYEDVKIFAEIYMDIHHSFVSMSENLKDIKRIYSHPQGYNQCRNFLESHDLSEVEFVASKSTAHAAYLASQDVTSAAICSKIAAKLYNVPILFETIEDNLANRTRFLILSDIKIPQMSHCKTSILALAAHKPGGLSDLLYEFKKEGINLTKLESRPIKTREFVHSFYIDFEGHIDDENVQRVLKKAEHIKWLGSYLSGESNEI